MQPFEPKDERRDGVARKREGRGDRRSGGEGRDRATARSAPRREGRSAGAKGERGRKPEVAEGLAVAVTCASLVAASGFFRYLWENVPDV